MSGDETTRFCAYCKKHVHNLEVMTVDERLALLSSPAASICARYKVAIRRPAPGKRASYIRHMMKYSAGVALTSSALLVLWEMYAENEKRTYYRAISTRPHFTDTGCGWGENDEKLATDSPEGFYVEQEVYVVGMMIAIPEPTKEIHLQPGGRTIAPHQIDLEMDPVEINRLLQPVNLPALDLKPVVPVMLKKAVIHAGLHGRDAS